MMTQNNEIMCTGCGVCAAVCPQKSLTIQPDNNGFYKAICNESSCVQCGLCEKVCPKYIEIEDKNPSRVMSAISNDKDTLQTTSSGGLCYEIAKRALADGKKVCSCVYNYEKHRAEHIAITDFEELEATKGSKYFQSYTPDAFLQVLDGAEWVVFGSPCQIAGLDAAAKAKKIRDRLLLVDFFCHGTPSMNLWKKYIQENGGSSIQKIDFRSKEFGWHTFSLRFTYKDGSTHSDYQDNMFYSHFFGHFCLGDACYSCHFKALKSAADIRVGDFWGTKYKDNRSGVSCCISFTQHGEDAIQALSSDCLIQNEQIEQVLEEQMSESPKMPSPRSRELKQLKGKRSLKKIYYTTLFFYLAKQKIRAIIRNLRLKLEK